MGLSVSGMRPIATTSYISKTPMMYGVENQSSVSSAYQESMESISTSAGISSVDGAAPVQYANTKSSSVSGVSQAQQVEEAFAAIAQGFAGVTTSYGQDMGAQQYEMLGTQFDQYA